MGSDQVVKVLLIDDDSTQHVLAKEYLGGAGFMVRVADDGQRGLSLAATTSPSIILLDVVLPTVDGYDICQELKQNPETADIPIVLVTASRDQDVIKRGLAAGATDFVTKPLDWEFLADRVKHVLHQQANNVTRHPNSPDAPALFDTSLILEKDQEIASLKDALADAEQKISTLNDEAQNAREHASAQEADADLEDLQNQLGEIEKEWSVRLQDAVTQANKRAEQRYQKLKSSVDEVTRDHDVAVQRLRQQLDLADQDKQALQQQKNELLEALAHQAEREAMAEQQIERQCLQFAEQSATLWRFIETKTESQRHALRDTQACAADLRKLAGDQPESERLHSIVDRIDMMMSSCVAEANKLRYLANHASGATAYEPDAFCLKSLVDELAGAVQADAGRLDVCINNGLQSELKIVADREALATAMRGLLANAITYSAPNGSVEMQAVQGNDGRLELRVIDRGFGIDSALLEDIKLFFDADAADIPAADKLLGSGLPIAKKIVKRHGGSLAIESVLGQGTTVVLTLPIATAVEAPAPGDGFELRAVS